MENKNIADILKNAPLGVLLYSPICGFVNFVHVFCDIGKRNHILVTSQFGDKNFEFDEFGKYNPDGECMLFPSKFHQVWDDWQNSLFNFGIFITNIDGYKETFVISGFDTSLAYNSHAREVTINKLEYRYATKEEKDAFIYELERNGYFWDENNCQIKMKMSDSNKEEVSNLHNYLYNEDRRVNKLEIDNYRLTALVLLITKHNLTKKEIEDSLNMLSKANTIKEINEVSDNISKLYGLTYLDDAAKAIIEQQASSEEKKPTFKIGDMVRIKERKYPEENYYAHYLDEMLDCAGGVYKVVKVAKQTCRRDKNLIDDDGFVYKLSGLRWNFVSPMLEPVVQKDISRIDKEPYLQSGRYYICSEDFYVNSEHQDTFFKCGEICHSDQDKTVKNHNGCMFIDGHDGNASVYFKEIDTSNKELVKVKQYAYERWHKLWQTIQDADKPYMTREDQNNLGRFMEIEQLNNFLEKL